ncbi:nuclear transport factor 2 family protein [Blastococcus sp. TF02A-30]|uniref:nuclear transport factor 2 family protein n=1 Tax=Blastococcus sp. TF02A-30 TaxID=2250580 RepID=UPI000DEA9E78|nr:nuclear transport factor 2 family protein [Blastococcus sp. TF02A-30]RBY92567.1 nuclear transport factor 2 family protein [Blastococcus sp. TF02A-30]
MTATPDLVDRYLAAWNETDPGARRAAVDALFSADARYTDPLADARGRDAIDATIAAVQAQFPGFVFRPVGTVDAHHDQVRFSWELGPAGQDAPIAGSDVALVDADGRISTVLGFLDRVPVGA